MLALDRAGYLRDRYRAELRWHPFELHPDTPRQGVVAPQRTSAEVRSHLASELAAAGLPVRRPLGLVNSRRALALSVWAGERPQWPRLHQLLFAAYWSEQRDISDPEVLVEVAGEAGLDPAEAAAALEAGTGEEGLRMAMDRALDLGIGATPGWHFGDGVVLTGAHPRRVFDRVMARLR